MIASVYKNIEILRLLIEAGADVNVRDYFGETALDTAISNNDTEIVDLLKRIIAKQNFKRISRKAAKRSIRNRVYLDEVVGLPYDIAERVSRTSINSFGKRTVKKVPSKIKKLCKRLKIKLTIKRGKKRVKKTLKQLKKEIKKKLKNVYRL